MISTTDSLQLSYIKEVEAGVTPASPALKKLRNTGESFAYAITKKQSDEIDGLGNVKDLIPVSAQASGGFNFELSYGTYDDIFESVMGGAWAADVLKNGQTVKPLTFEKRFFTGISNDEETYAYLRYRGMVGNTMSLEFASNEIIKGSCDFLGRSSEVGTSIIASATYIPPTSAQVLSAASHMGTLTFGSFASPKLLSASLEMNHNTKGAGVIGSTDFADIQYGEFSLTGTLAAYFEDADMYNAYLESTSLGLSITVGSGSGSKYKFEIPALKLSDCQVVAGSKNDFLVANMPFQALYSPTNACTLIITRAVA